MKRKSGSWLMVIAVAAVIALAVYASYIVNGGKNPLEQYVSSEEPTAPVYAGDTSAAAGDYYAAFRTDRDNVRAQEIMYLDALAQDAATDAETKKQAQQQKLELVNNMEKEVTIEGVLKAKGFEKVAVTVHKGSVNIIIDGELKSEAVAQILDIARRETGERVENIKILPRS